jgi:hypothetical protein
MYTYLLALLVQRLPLQLLVVVDGVESALDCQDLDSWDDDVEVRGLREVVK